MMRRRRLASAAMRRLAVSIRADLELRKAMDHFIASACACGHEPMLHEPACIVCATRPVPCSMYHRAVPALRHTEGE